MFRYHSVEEPTTSSNYVDVGAPYLLIAESIYMQHFLLETGDLMVRDPKTRTFVLDIFPSLPFVSCTMLQLMVEFSRHYVIFTKSSGAGVGATNNPFAVTLLEKVKNGNMLPQGSSEFLSFFDTQCLHLLQELLFEANRIEHAALLYCVEAYIAMFVYNAPTVEQLAIKLQTPMVDPMLAANLSERLLPLRSVLPLDLFRESKQ